MKNNNIKEYKKHNSFLNFSSKKEENKEDIISIVKSVLDNQSYLKKFSRHDIDIIKNIKNDLFSDKKKNNETFKLSEHVFAEIKTIDESQLLRYLIHRYRYEIFPLKNIIDDYPPYLQIEPSSICNYRCVFCFETDKTFTNKKNGFMGTMSLDLFKNIVDQAQNNIEFISIASRGEPFVCKDIDKMLEYTTDKFLNLKINTNASLLNEKSIHAILSGGVKTIVFSADAADEKLYSELRVNGSLKKVLKNIELFNKIKETSYSGRKIITRVSGVKFNDQQSINSMKNLWQGLVDQVAFVDYNPWENIYDRESNKIIKPCSDLWRRMFVWWDGKINPCDSDYKSKLCVGNIKETDLSKIWKSQIYNNYRNKHFGGKRKDLNPCKSCAVT